MKLKSLAAAAALAVSVVLITGCDQAEKSAQQLMGKAAESAKQAIDDTHKAAEQALSDATGSKEKADDGSEKKQSPSQEI